MDINFIQQEHRDNIFKIMELCDCDMAEAYQLYNNNGCNVENAVQAKFNSFENHDTIPPTYKQSYNKPKSYVGTNVLGEQKSGHIMNEQEAYQKYKHFKRNNLNFNKRYEVRRDSGGITRSLISFFKNLQNTFKKDLQSYIGRRTNMNFQNGSLSEAFEFVSKQKFALVVHVVDFSNKQPAVLNVLKKLYSFQLLGSMLNEQFKSYGVDRSQYNLEPFLKQFIDLKNDVNCLLIFRVNAYDEIVLLQKLSILSITPQEIKKKLHLIKSNCIQVEMDEIHLQKRFHAERQGNYEYQKPMSLAEQRKLQEDRLIRKKQEEEFFAAMQQKKPQQKHSNTSTNMNNYPQSQIQSQSSKLLVKKDLKEEEKQKRKQIRNNLKVYENDGNGMLAIKLRLPSSEMIKMYVHSLQTAQYLYDFVYSREQDLGFEDDESRRVFDIIEPYQKLNLSQRKNQKLGKIFGDETMLTLVVNEKVE